MKNPVFPEEKTQNRLRPLPPNSFSLISYCLMPNHFHLLLRQNSNIPTTKLLAKICTSYSIYFNKKYDRVGGLFQGRFQAIRVDNDIHLQYLLVYINVLNPGQLLEPNLKEEGIRNIEGIMEFAAGYPWSTHQEYLDKRESRIIDKGICDSFFRNPVEYQDFVRRVLEAKKYRNIEHLFLE